MKDLTKLGMATVAALALVTGVYYFSGRQPSSPDISAAPPATAPQAAAPEPAIRYPVPEVAPTLQPGSPQAEQAVRDALDQLFGQKAVRQLLRLDAVARNVVATVDNLPREKVAQRLSPVNPASGRLIVRGRQDTLAIAPQNAERYTPYVNLLSRVDSVQLVDAYARLYPLFQQAYEELGYPRAYFNDRLVAVIDHLLAAPEPEGPLRLIQPHVLYQYADLELERASAGHKIMVRMGLANERQVKAKLRDIRQELTRGTPR
jgi:hypothetical protein